MDPNENYKLTNLRSSWNFKLIKKKQKQNT